MGDRWGGSGPPDEAYSRVSRDLAVVTADFSRYLDELPGRLERTHLCRVRSLSDAEVEHLHGLHPGAHDDSDSGYAVEPQGDARAVLLVSRSSFEGGAQALFTFGLVSWADVPDCFCDACDADSESLIEESEDFIQMPIGGCVEFRRERRFDELPSWATPIEGTWLEEGYRTDGSFRAHSNPELRGAPFEREWLPWLTRA
ncbi:MAG: hypothetical protein QOK15_306 [Nocardioidaceae bacterium]|nr:hypothetical protein [Nocardioidaceae bacterium]